MLPIQQPWEREAAYRKGYAKGLAASDPARMVTVNLSSFSTPPDTLGIPRWISLKVQQNTPVHDVLTEIHRRLPEIAYPFTISTLGTNSRDLNLDDRSSIIMDFLTTFDAETLSLRLNLQLPQHKREPRRSLRSRLRSAFGTGDARSRDPQDGHAAVLSTSDEGGSSQAGGQPTPPSYDEAMRSGLPAKPGYSA